jgi:hypothetical protein
VAQQGRGRPAAAAGRGLPAGGARSAGAAGRAGQRARCPTAAADRPAVGAPGGTEPHGNRTGRLRA